MAFVTIPGRPKRLKYHLALPFQRPRNYGVTEANQIVRHLLENEEDVDDLDVGLPFPIEDFLGRHRFVRATPHDLGWERVYDRGEFRFRVGHSQEDGTRTVQFIRGAMPLWTKHLTDEETVEMIDRNSRIGEAEEDFGDEDGAWKDVTPPVPASEIQRWCFTDFELKKPNMCSGTDEFLADGDAELAVIVLRNGTVTDRWEDGTIGVPPHCAQMADLDESPINPEQRRSMFNDEDYYADNWRDVYVGKKGEFLGFVVRESEEEFEDDFDNDMWKHVSLPPQENITWKTLLKYFPNLQEIAKDKNITLRFEDNCLIIHNRLGPREWRYDVFRMECVVGDQWELVPLGSFNDYIEALQACLT